MFTIFLAALFVLEEKPGNKLSIHKLNHGWNTKYWTIWQDCGYNNFFFFCNVQNEELSVAPHNILNIPTGYICLQFLSLEPCSFLHINTSTFLHNFKHTENTCTPEIPILWETEGRW